MFEPPADEISCSTLVLFNKFGTDEFFSTK